jgi:hypothetical protein
VYDMDAFDELDPAADLLTGGFNTLKLY